MGSFKIEYSENLNEETEHRMSTGFIEYEKSHGIDVNYKTFAFILSDENGIAFGVLNAYTAFEEVYLDDIWVHESLRGKGYGRQLLNTLELHFKGKNYNNINLVTSAFQAPDFYKKCGYQVEFVRINKTNPKLTKTFFVKYF